MLSPADRRTAAIAAAALVISVTGSLAGSAPILTVAVLVLAGLAVAAPGAVTAAAILAAPLHLYRRPLPEPLSDLAGSINVSGFRLCVLAAAFGLVVTQLLPRPSPPRLTSLRAFLAVSALFAAVGTWQIYEAYRSLSPLGSTLVSSSGFFMLAALTVMAAVLLGALDARDALLAIVASAALPLAYGLYQLLGPGAGAEKFARPVPLSGLLEAGTGTDQTRGGGFGTNGRFRPAAFFSDPNFLAVFSVGVIVAIDQLRGVIARRPAVAGQVLALVVLLGTLSRTGLIMLGAYVLARLLLHWTRDGRFAPRLPASRASRAAVAGAVLAALVAMTLVLNARDSSGSTASHLETIEQAVELWADYPFEGAGLGNFGYRYGQPFDRSSAQSFPFTVLAEQGLIGILLLGALFVGLPWWAGRGWLGLLRVPLAFVMAAGMLFYDFPLSIDVCAVWLGLAAAARWAPGLRLQT